MNVNRRAFCLATAFAVIFNSHILCCCFCHHRNKRSKRFWQTEGNRTEHHTTISIKSQAPFDNGSTAYVIPAVIGQSRDAVREFFSFKLGNWPAGEYFARKFEAKALFNR